MPIPMRWSWTAGKDQLATRKSFNGEVTNMETDAESVLIPGSLTCHPPAETATWSTITQIYEGTNQIQRVVMARQLLK